MNVQILSPLMKDKALEHVNEASRAYPYIPTHKCQFAPKVQSQRMLNLDDGCPSQTQLYRSGAQYDLGRHHVHRQFYPALSVLLCCGCSLSASFSSCFCSSSALRAAC